MNPEDNRRLSVYPQVEVEPTANVCPSGPSRDAGDQGRDGRIIWAGSRSKPARQARVRGRGFDSGHGKLGGQCSAIRRWDYSVLERAIGDLCRRTEGQDWAEVAA
jgi:hypothetical protein